MNNKKSTLRKRQAMETHQLIYQTALALFAKKGYQKVTISEICRKSGVSLGSFYVHFKSKDEVIWEQFAKVNDYIRKTALPQIEQIDNPVNKIELLCNSLLTYINGVGSDNVKVVLQSQISPDKEATAIEKEKNSMLFKLTYSFVEMAQKGNSIRRINDILGTTRILNMTMWGIIYYWCLENGSYNIIDTGNKAVKAITRGLFV